MSSTSGQKYSFPMEVTGPGGPLPAAPVTDPLSDQVVHEGTPVQVGDPLPHKWVGAQRGAVVC